MKILAGLVGATLLFLGSSITLLTAVDLIRKGAWIDWFVTGFFLATAAAGAWLFDCAIPGVWTRAARRIYNTLTTPATLWHPAAQTIVLFSAGALAVTLFKREPTVPVFAATTIYAIASPILIAIRPGWWRHAAWSVMGMILLFLALPATAESIAGRNLGETSMILLAPMMAFPLALAGSGLVRLVQTTRARARTAAQGSHAFRRR